jgi:DNA-binding NarL/FixJ family response regulator
VLERPAEQPRSDRIADLSPRESEVLRLASGGLSNTQIASRLSVTSHAVKFHLSSVYRKLGVANRTQASSFYLISQLAPRDKGVIG